MEDRRWTKQNGRLGGRPFCVPDLELPRRDLNPRPGD
jgi:hypothetical protein